MASGKAQYRSGAFIGTGAELSIQKEKVGFKPKSVKLYNSTTKINMVHVADDMSAGEGWKSVDGGGGVFDLSLVTSNGVTLTETGFTVGTDSVNTADALIFFEAWG